MKNKYDVVIVGTGAAGLFAALHFPEDYQILMITKDKLENSDSFLAQGGICCLLNDDDYDCYYEDTMKAGHYENRPESVAAMIKGSQHAIKQLIDYHVDFDRDQAGNLLFTREGGHRRFRILHHHDNTGQEIVEKLILAAEKQDNIHIAEYTVMLDLIVDDNRCCGIVVRDKTGVEAPIYAKAVILATGGLGGLFHHSSNFPHITGDSFAIALRHGIRLENLHYIQIHPTVLYSKRPGRRFLISESVRGEGAKLLNENRERFTDELKPRDIVSNAIREEMAKFGTDHVYLSFDDIPVEEILRHFPNIYQRCLEEGYDIKKEVIPVTPAQHYLMGGIWADTFGRTSMENLYAVGETACNGVHGANRLASNSLLESLVFSENAAKLITQKMKNISDVEPKVDLHYPSQEKWAEENKKLVMHEIERKGKSFYDKWRNI